MREYLIASLLIFGTFLSIVSALGILRLPDILMRLQAMSKASTLGITCTVAAVALYFNSAEISVRALFVITFLFLTSPILAHLIARNAYHSDAPLWKGTVCNDLPKQYKTSKPTEDAKD